MARYVFVVYSNAVDGREQEYNDWYSNQHLNDLRAFPGVISARRLTLAELQFVPRAHAHKYLSLYELETDDLQGFKEEMLARIGTDRMPRSDALSDDVSAVLWKVL